MSFITNKPAWFDLSNYPDFNAENIQPEWNDESKWAYNFYIRLEIINAFKNSSTINESIKEKITTCRKEGFLIYPFGMFGTLGNIKSLTIQDVGNLYQSVSGEEKKQIDKYNIKGKANTDNDIRAMLDGTGRNKKSVSINETELLSMMESIEKIHDDAAVPVNTDIAHVSINLNAPLNTLIEEFSVFIKKKKVKTSISNKTEITIKKIKGWVEHQVLAYLDLLIYATEQGKEIKHKDYGDWLFPDDIINDTTEKFRKSTIPKAKEVLTPEFLKYVASQGKATLNI